MRKSFTFRNSALKKFVITSVECHNRVTIMRDEPIGA